MIIINNLFHLGTSSLFYPPITFISKTVVMGGSPSRQLTTPSEDGFSTRFTFVRSHGPISFYLEHLTGKEYATKVCVCDTPEEQNSFFSSMDKTREIAHDNILAVEKIYAMEANAACSSDVKKYLVLLPYPFRSVKDERDERVVLGEGFSEPEIWSILLSVCKSMLFLQDRGIPYSPLSSENILVDKQGVIQIDGNHLVGNSLIQDSYISRNKKLRYLPPELKQTKLNYLKIREVEKCNVYSLGIVVLECLEKRDLVQIENLDLQKREFLQLLINRESFVSSELRQMVRRLTESPESRPTYREIISYIESEETSSNLLYHQNEISTAKKPTFNNDFMVNTPFDIGVSNAKANFETNAMVPMSSTVAYTIPSFSYNNINAAVSKPQEQETQNVQRVISVVPTTQITETVYETPKVGQHRYENSQERGDLLSTPTQSQVQRPLQELSNLQAMASFSKPYVADSLPASKPFLVQKVISLPPVPHYQMNTPVQHIPQTTFIPHFSLPNTATCPIPQITNDSVANQVKHATPKPSYLARESAFPNKTTFSHGGLLEGFNKMYNEFPSKFYQKFDYRNLNDLGGLWLYYEGNFKDGQRHGPGTLYMSNGEIFEGNFINDVAEGRGKYSTLQWRTLQGIWKDGLLSSLL